MRKVFILVAPVTNWRVMFLPIVSVGGPSTLFLLVGLLISCISHQCYFAWFLNRFLRISCPLFNNDNLHISRCCWHFLFYVVACSNVQNFCELLYRSISNVVSSRSPVVKSQQFCNQLPEDLNPNYKSFQHSTFMKTSSSRRLLRINNKNSGLFDGSLESDFIGIFSQYLYKSLHLHWGF